MKRNKVILIIGTLICVTIVVLFKAHLFVYKSNFIHSDVDVPQKKISLKHTSWELVQYSDGNAIQNLLGTDWVLSFENDEDGFLKLCDTYFFKYGLSENNLSVSFNETVESSCTDSILGDPQQYIEVLAYGSKIEKTLFKEGDFKTILTIVHNNRKLVFIPHEFESISKHNHKERVTFTYEKNNTCLVPCVFMLSLISENPNQKTQQIQFTEYNNEVVLDIEVGSYTLSSADKSDTGYPLLFTVVKNSPYNSNSIALP